MIDFPAVPPGEALTISASTYLAFLRCPEQAGARFRGIYAPVSLAMFRGKLAHRLFARHLTEGEIGAARFEQACRQEIGTGMNMDLSSLRLRPSQLAAVIAEAGELYERFKALPVEGWRDAEVEIEVVPADGVTLRGTIDALFDEDGGGVRLVDWKTGAVGDDAHEQLSFYALLWALHRSELPGRVEAISVRTGERKDAVPSRAQLADTVRAVADLVTELRGAWGTGLDLKRRGGPWCRYCPVLEGCAEGQAATGPGAQSMANVT